MAICESNNPLAYPFAFDDLLHQPLGFFGEVFYHATGLHGGLAVFLDMLAVLELDVSRPEPRRIVSRPGGARIPERSARFEGEPRRYHGGKRSGLFWWGQRR